MKRIILGALLPLVPGIMLADGVISGKVINKENGEPIDFANVQLIDSKTSKPLPIGTQTDEAGVFTLPKVKDGEYVVKITNIGSVEQERPVKVLGKDIAIGTVVLAPDSKMLQEVVVEGIRSQMRFELDKKVFSVDANIASAGASASELLESIPSVEVDQDGEVSLRGNSSVTVWINGKDSGLTADNRAQILEQIPAETIESIEVITNPSAKYSPEGTAGIINIILKKNRKAGYYGGAEVGGNTRGGANASVNFNYTSGVWDAFASVGYRHRRSTGGSTVDRYYSDDTEMHSVSDSKNYGNNVFVRLGGTWHMTTKDELSLSGFGMFGHGWGSSYSEYHNTYRLPQMWTLNRQSSNNSRDMRGIHAELGYTHNWNDTRKIDFSLAFNRWSGPHSSAFLQHQEYEQQTNIDDVYQSEEQTMGSNSWEGKIDFTSQLLPWLKMEAGYNGEYSHEDSPTIYYTGTSAADAQINKQMYDRFIYNNNISALYATLGGKYRDLSFSAGVRAEAWQIRAKSLEYGEDKHEGIPFKKNNFALFPSAYLSYSLPYDNELQINYTRRIRRPWGGQLNSHEHIGDPTNVEYGNPQLQPEYSNAFELNYIKSWTHHMISLSGYLRTSNDLMERVSYMNGDVLYTTWANVSSRVNSGVEIVGKNQLFSNHLDLTTTVNLYNTHMSAWDYSLVRDGKTFNISGDKKNSFAWDARVMANVRLPWGISLQVMGAYNSKMILAQGTRNAGWRVDAGLRKTVGNWSFSINARDIFDSRKFSGTTYGDGYWQKSEFWRNGRTIRFSVKYSFGNMRAKKRNMDEGEPMDASGYGETE